MISILALDDDAQRHIKFNKWFLVNYTRTWDAHNTITQLNENNFTHIFLDHDLGGEIFVREDHPNTGSEVVRHMITDDMVTKFKNTMVIIHSMNTPAAESMANKLLYAGYQFVQLVPFYSMTDSNMTDFYKQINK